MPYNFDWWKKVQVNPGGGGKPVTMSNAALTEATPLIQQQGGQVYQSPDNPNAVDVVGPAQQGQTFWESPYRVARYYNFLRSQPPGYQPPEWLNRDAIDRAYRWYQYANKGANWTQWKPLAPDDPARPWLQTLPPPPDNMLWPNEKQYAKYDPTNPAAPGNAQEQGSAQQVMGNWNNLKPWQQINLSLLSPQSLEGKPEAARAFASTVGGAMAGLGAVWTVAAGAGLATLLGATAPVSVPALFAIGLAVGIPTALAAYNNTDLPVIGNVNNILAQAWSVFERGAGIGLQAQNALAQPEEKRGAALLDLVSHLPQAAEAAQFYFETSPYQIANLEAAAFGDQPAGPGQTWKIERGLATPQPVEGTTDWGQRVSDLRQELESGKTIDQLYAEVADKYGFSGTLNDFVGNILLAAAAGGALKAGGVRAGEVVARKTGNVRAAEAFHMAQGNPVIDVLPPGLQQAAEFITKQHPSQGIVQAFRNYKNLIRTGGMAGEAAAPRAAAELSPVEKMVGGLTPEGVFRELEPAPAAAGRPPINRFFSWFGSLTPESKAVTMLGLFTDNLGILLEKSHLDPEKTVTLLKKAAGVDPVTAGDMGEAFLKSPETATVAAAYREFIKSGAPDEMLATWAGSATPRNLLLNLAKILKEEPGKVLEAFDKTPDAELARIREMAKLSTDPVAKDILSSIDGGSLNGKAVKQVLSPFLGNDAIPWHPGDFSARLNNAMWDATTNWLATRYDLKPDHWTFRLGSALKAAQSLILLNYNPNYAINNLINNVSTRAFEGIFGRMTATQVKTLWDRMGITPARLKEGIGMAGEGIRSEAGMAAIHKAMSSDDLINRFRQTMKNVSNKVGVFNRFSAKIEQMESEQAYSIGMTRFWSGNWKKNVGFRAMPPDLEAALTNVDPKLPGFINTLVEAGMNMDEIRNSVLGGPIGKPYEVSYADAITKMSGGDASAAARMHDLLETTGLADDLKTRLAGVKTPEDAQLAIDNFKANLGRWNDQRFGDGIVGYAQSIANVVKSEGFPAALQTFGDVQERIMGAWLNHFIQMEDGFQRAAKMDFEHGNAHLNSLMAEQTVEWRRVQALEASTLKGIFDGLGIDSQITADYVKGMTNLHDMWARFYEGGDAVVDGKRVHTPGRNEMYREFFAKKYKSYEERMAALDQTRAAVQAMYDEAVNAESLMQQKLDNQFAEAFAKLTGRPADEALAWRNEVADLRASMVDSMNKFRERMRTENWDSATIRNEWQRFLATEYQPKIVELKRAEVQGAYEMSGQPAPAAPVMGGEAVPIEGTPTAITRPMRQKLSEMGYTRAEVKAMTPEQAVKLINDGEVSPKQTRLERVSALTELARKYKIPTATANGEPFNTALLRVVNKYAGTAFTALDEVPVDVAAQALKLRALLKIDPTVERMENLTEAQQAAYRAAKEAAYVEDAAGGGTFGADVTQKPNITVNVSGVKGAVPGPLDAMVEQGLKLLTSDDPATSAQGERMLHMAMQPAIDFIEKNMPWDHTTEFTFGRTEGASEPSLSLHVSVPEQWTNAFLYTISNIADKVFGQDKVLISREIADPRQVQFGLFQSPDPAVPTSFVEPVFYYKFDKTLTGVDIAKLNEIIKSPGVELPGYSLSDNKVVLEISRVEALANGETVNNYLSRVSEFVGRLRNAGYTGVDAVGSRETWLLQRAASNEYGGAWSHADIQSKFEASSPTDALPLKQKITQTPYLYTPIPGFEYFPETVAPFEHGGYTINARIYGKDGLLAYALEAQHPGKVLDVAGDQVRLLGLDPTNPQRMVVLADGKIKKLPFLEPTVPTDPNLGTVPLGSVPTTMPEGFAVHEVTSEQINPFLNQLQEEIVAGLNDKGANVANLAPAERTALQGYLNQVESDMASTKLTGLRYAEQMRDLSLLNYTRRYGADMVGDLAMPYQFWATRTIANWAMRLIDNPQWFAMAALYREAQRKMAVKGIPQRLEGQMRMPFPFMPSWMGGGVWFDPMHQLFPPDQFGNPLTQLQNQKSQDEKDAVQVLRGWSSNHTASEKDVQDAILTKVGPLWERALATANGNAAAEGASNPLDVLKMMVSPSIFWSIPAAVFGGHADQLPLLPVTRTGQGLQSVLKGTPFEAIGNVVGGTMAWPETAIRKAAGLSEFGQWGQYYIDRELTNMAGDAEYSADAVREAMISKSGPIYNEAVNRVQTQLGFKVGGMLPIYAATHGASPPEIGMSALAGLFPSGLLPAGELAQRGLSEEYNTAWKAYMAGDKKALTHFFDAHPEYQARLALKDNPDDRMRNFLVSQLWDKYSALESSQKTQVRNQFGEPFTTMFLDKNTQDYTAIPINTLAGWVQSLKGVVPTPAGGAPLAVDKVDLTLYTPGQAKVITSYQKTRDQKFPNWYAAQAGYYASADKHAYLMQFPWLKTYWGWKADQGKADPVLAKYFADQKAQAAKNGATTTAASGQSSGGGGGGSDSTRPPRSARSGRGRAAPPLVQHLTGAQLRMFSKPLLRQLFSYYLGNIPLTEGALAELQMLYAEFGPATDFKTWLDGWIKPSFVIGGALVR